MISASADTSAKVYRSKENSKMQIALTFDDGPHPIYTERILKILKKYGVKATFFMIGENITNYTETALKVKNEGHEIGNHTTSHPSCSRICKHTLMKEIIDCSEIILNFLDYETSIFRPPEGILPNTLLECCSTLEYSIILWNIDTRDWAHTPAKMIAENVISNASAGDIILMHDYIGKGSPTPDALEIILPKLIEKGYEFVTVSELISSDEDSEPSFIHTADLVCDPFKNKMRQEKRSRCDTYIATGPYFY